MATNDPYAVLGLAPGADVDAIRRAFRRCARHTHPDAGGDAAAFARVRCAYEMLRPGAARVTPDGPPVSAVVPATGHLVRRQTATVPYPHTPPARTWTREIREEAPARTVAPTGFADVLAEALRRVA